MFFWIYFRATTNSGPTQSTLPGVTQSHCTNKDEDDVKNHFTSELNIFWSELTVLTFKFKQRREIFLFKILLPEVHLGKGLHISIWPKDVIVDEYTWPSDAPTFLTRLKITFSRCLQNGPRGGAKSGEYGGWDSSS